jgi:hypothetical protein
MSVSISNVSEENKFCILNPNHLLIYACFQFSVENSPWAVKQNLLEKSHSTS